MAEQDVPGRPVSSEREDAPHDAPSPIWTYDSWFAGWYQSPRESEKQSDPALAD